MEMTPHPADSKAELSTLHGEGDPAPALKSLLNGHPLSGEFETALPARNVMMMVLDLPATDRADLDGMVRLQAEEISPFPPERTCVSWEILQQDPPQTRVLMALCARRELDQLQTLYAGTGKLPRRVDVDVLGWIELLKSGGPLADRESALLVLLKGAHAHAVAWHRGAPCLIRSWIDARHFSQETLQEELMMLQLSLNSSFVLEDPPTLELWCDGAPPDWTGQPPSGWRIECHTLDNLPPLSQGLLRRSLRGRVLDLAPADWKAERQRQESRKKILRSLSLAGAGWLLLMGMFLGWSQIRQSDLRRLKKQIRADRGDAESVQELSAKVRSLTQFTDRSSSALESLRLLASATPGTGTLIVDDYRYDKEEGVVFSGVITGDVQPFYQFLENLAAGDLLRVKSYDLKESREGFGFQVETLWAWIQPGETEDAQ